MAQAVMFAQHLPAGWATLVWGCLVQEAGVLRLTRKDPDRLPDTAAKTASSQVGQVGVFRSPSPGGAFSAAFWRSAWSGKPNNTGTSSAESRASNSRSAPERSAWPELVHSTSEPSRRTPPVVPRRRWAPPFPSLQWIRIPSPRHLRTPGSACPVTAPPSITSVSTQAANAFQRQLLQRHPSLGLLLEDLW